MGPVSFSNSASTCHRIRHASGANESPTAGVRRTASRNTPSGMSLHCMRRSPTMRIVAAGDSGTAAGADGWTSGGSHNAPARSNNDTGTRSTAASMRPDRHPSPSAAVLYSPACAGVR